MQSRSKVSAEPGAVSSDQTKACEIVNDQRSSGAGRR
jgi:hypothetical protein